MRDYNDMASVLVEVWNCGVGSTTSPVQAEVIPRLVGIDGGGFKGDGYCI